MVGVVVVREENPSPPIPLIIEEALGSEIAPRRRTTSLKIRTRICRTAVSFHLPGLKSPGSIQKSDINVRRSVLTDRHIDIDTSGRNRRIERTRRASCSLPGTDHDIAAAAGARIVGVGKKGHPQCPRVNRIRIGGNRSHICTAVRVEIIDPTLISPAT